MPCSVGDDPRKRLLAVRAVHAVLEEEGSQAITLDQWENLLEVLKICGDSIENYDEMGACKFVSGERE